MTSRSDRVDQEAADWVVRLSEPEAERGNTKEQFLRWLTLSPEHRKTFTQTMDVSCALGNLDRSRRIDVRELIRRGSPKIIQLSPAGNPPDPGGVRSVARRLRRRRVILALLVCLFGVVLTLPDIGVAENSGPPTETTYARTLYLVRHGTYDYQEGVDPDKGLPLIPLGIAQAKLVAARLRVVPGSFDSLTASTMTRARETAIVIAEQFPSLSLQTTTSLRECTPQTFSHPGKDTATGEAAAACEQQLTEAFKTYFVPAKGAEKNSLLVCHGNVIRYFVMKALGVDTRAWTGMSVANASLTIIRVTPSGSFQVLDVGDIGHLPPSMVSGWSGRDPTLSVPRSMQ